MHTTTHAGTTALMHATMAGHMACVSVLLELGGSVQQANQDVYDQRTAFTLCRRRREPRYHSCAWRKVWLWTTRATAH